MVYVVPTKYTVRRPFTGGGVRYEIGHVLTHEELRSLGRLQPLVSSGRIGLEPDPTNRRNARSPKALPPQVMRTATEVVEQPKPKRQPRKRAASKKAAAAKVEVEGQEPAPE